MKLKDGEPPKGILNREGHLQEYEIFRYEPKEDTGQFVQHYWVITWDLRGQGPKPQTVLAHPNVNLVVERGNSRIYGLTRARSTQVIEGVGRVVSVKFKPGGFYPWWQAPVSSLTGTSIPWHEVFGLESKPLEEELLAIADPAEAAERLDQLLREHLPATDPNVLFVSELVYRIRDDRSIVKVEDVVSESGLRTRTLQRLFDRYVGVSPKGVIQRYRMHEAAERLSQVGIPDWMDISMELGYYDQSHFIRDFKSILGVSPAQFARVNS